MATTHVATPLAERLVYSRPDYRTAEVPLVGRPGTALVARILLGAIFLMSGIAKILHYDQTLGHMRAAGVPHAEILLPIAAIAELAGAVSLMTGFLARLGALGLAIWLIPVTLTFHAFWGVAPDQMEPQMINFMKNLAIMGGLSAFVAFGAGRYSVDHLIRKPLQA